MDCLAPLLLVGHAGCAGYARSGVLLAFATYILAPTLATRLGAETVV